MATIEDQLQRPPPAAGPRIVVARPRPTGALARRVESRAVRRERDTTQEQPLVSPEPTTSVRNVLIVFGVGLVLATLVGARGLVHSAYGMTDGPERSIFLAVGQSAVAVTEAVGLTWPWDHVSEALGKAPLQTNAPLLGGTRSGDPPRSPRPTKPRSVLPTIRAPVLRTPTVARPLRLLVTGDSLTEFLGPQLVDMAAHLKVVRGSSDTHYGTGLVRPDFVDWSVVARQQITEYHPEAVVVFIGGNDFQNMTMPSGRIIQASSPAWTREYARRAAVVMRVWLHGGARRVYWLSMPPARSDAWSRNNAQINVALREAARAVPGARYLNIIGPITDHGRYADYVPVGGTETLVRAPDGIHLTETGSSIVAGEVLGVLKHDWHLLRRQR